MQASSRVRLLSLRLSLPALPAPELADARRDLEQRFMRELLERCAATVQARVGAEALVYVKRLRVRWQLDEQRIGEASLPSTLGEELGELLLAQLDALTPRQRLRPRADAELALFRGAGHLHAAHVADRAAGGDGAAWFFADVASADPWRALVSGGGAELLRATLAWLERMEVADAAVLGAAGDVIAELARLVPLRQWPIAAATARAAAAAATAATRGKAADADPNDSGLIGGVATAATASAPPITSPAADATSSTANAATALDARSPASPSDTAPAAPSVAPPSTVQPGAAASSAASPLVDSSERRDEGGRARDGDDNAVAACDDAEPGEDGDDGLTLAASFATRYAGLFYLAGRVQELDLAEHLYCAGALEGDFLAHVARLLITDSDGNSVGDRDVETDRDANRAACLFGGRVTAAGHDARVELPSLATLPRWAIDEIRAKLSQSLAERLRHRGLAPLSGDALAEALHAAEATLPPAAVGDDDTTALVRFAAAALLHLFQAALSEPGHARALFAHLAVAGEVTVEPELVRVRLAGGAVEVPLRLAGFDFDPGFVPWLQRRLVFEFVED